MREFDKGAMFPKDNIAGDTKTMKDRIITPIPFLSFAIAKKTTKFLTEAQVCYAHVAEEERNKQNRRSEGGDNLEVTQHEEQCHRNAKQLGKHIECT